MLRVTQVSHLWTRAMLRHYDDWKSASPPEAEDTTDLETKIERVIKSVPNVSGKSTYAMLEDEMVTVKITCPVEMLSVVMEQVANQLAVKGF